MTSPAAGKRRKDKDVICLIESKHEVEIMDSLKHFMVKFNGPANTPYEGGVWKIRVMLPDDYPFKSPSIGFVNRIFHPNIDEASGTVCLDVINQTWTPLYDLVNIFETFLPQLLTYPNPADPLNGDAASMLMSRPSEYERRIRECVKKYATPDAFVNIRDKSTPLSSHPASSSANRTSQQRSSVSSVVVGTLPGTASINRNNNSAASAGATIAIDGPVSAVVGARAGAATAVAASHTIVSSSMPPAVNFGRRRVAAEVQEEAASAAAGALPQSGAGNSAFTLSNEATAAAAAVAAASHGRPATSNGTTGAARGEDVPKNDDDDDDDDGEASDLSEFSENEADHMDL